MAFMSLKAFCSLSPQTNLAFAESDGGADNQALQHLLRQQGVEAFDCLKEIDPLIDVYQKISYNKVKIKKSLPDSFCLTFAMSTREVSVPDLCWKASWVLMSCLLWSNLFLNILDILLCFRLWHLCHRNLPQTKVMTRMTTRTTMTMTMTIPGAVLTTTMMTLVPLTNCLKNCWGNGMLMASHVWRKTLIPWLSCTNRNQKITYPLLGVWKMHINSMFARNILSERFKFLSEGAEVMACL